MPEGPPYDRIACFLDRTDEGVIGAGLSVCGRLLADGGTLSVVHVAPATSVLAAGLSGWPLDPEDPVRPVREWLDRETAHLGDIERVVLTGDHPPELGVEWAERSGVDLVVAAAHSTRVQRAALGSFTDGLARHARVPVLVVPRSAVAPPSFAHLVCCIDDSPAASAALTEAVRLREAAGPGRLTLLRTVSPPRPFRMRALTRLLPAPRAQSRQARGRLEAAAARTPGATPVLLTGVPSDIPAWADANDADMIVIGTHGDRSGPRALGTFAHTVCLHATTPVLLVPPAPAGGAAG